MSQQKKKRKKLVPCSGKKKVATDRTYELPDERKDDKRATLAQVGGGGGR